MRGLILLLVLASATSTAAHPRSPSEHWVRLPGVWFPTKAAAPSTVRFVGQDQIQLRGFTAIYYDTPISADSDAEWRIRAEIDPVEGEQASLGWISFMLAGRPQELGWVTADENEVGVLVRSNGEIQVFGGGAEWPYQWAAGPPAPAATYAVELVVRSISGNDGRSLRIEGRINQARFTALVPASGPGTRQRYVAIGAHFHPGDRESSWVRGLAFSRLARAR